MTPTSTSCCALRAGRRPRLRAITKTTSWTSCTTARSPQASGSSTPSPLSSTSSTMRFSPNWVERRRVHPQALARLGDHRRPADAAARRAASRADPAFDVNLLFTSDRPRAVLIARQQVANHRQPADRGRVRRRRRRRGARRRRRRRRPRRRRVGDDQLGGDGRRRRQAKARGSGRRAPRLPRRRPAPRLWRRRRAAARCQAVLNVFNPVDPVAHLYAPWLGGEQPAHRPSSPLTPRQRPPPTATGARRRHGLCRRCARCASTRASPRWSRSFVDLTAAPTLT